MYAPAAVYVAAVHREMGGLEASFSALSSAAETCPRDPGVLLALANECLYGDQPEVAAKLARR